MPNYCYKCPKCRVKDTLFRTVASREIPVVCRACGDTMKRDLETEHAGFRHTPGNWPMASTAAGVHPDQAAEARAKSVRDGVPTEFNRDGDPVFTSRGHRKRYLQTIGMIDRSAGYGD